MTIETVSHGIEKASYVGGPAVFFAAAVFLATLCYLLQDEKPYPGFHLVGKRKDEWFNSQAKARYMKSAKQILKQGLEECKGPFQIIGRNGPIIVLPPSYAEEIRNDERLSIAGQLEKDFFPSYPGLEPFHASTNGDIFQDMIRKNLTQSIGGMTASLSEEMNRILPGLIPATKEWCEIKFLALAPQIAARMSAKVFLGEPLCRNQEWIQISIRYTIDSFIAARKLRRVPAFVRPLVHRFFPEMHVIREHVRTARAIIEPEVATRRQARRDAVMAEKPLPRPADVLEWLDAVAGERPFDVALGQLLLSVAAIHTSTRFLTGLMYDLAENPEYIDLLRKEIVQVLAEDKGWKKTSLYKMRLMDSCMKESQRMHVVAALTMNRRVEEPFMLSDGHFLPKHAILAVATYQMMEEDHWSDANKFNGHRFLRMREQPGLENRWQFVSTNPEHLGFGHGKHACPGRFFASNALKVVLIHLLMKYDWKFEGEAPRSLLQSEFAPDPNAGIMCRARTPEIEL